MATKQPVSPASPQTKPSEHTDLASWEARLVRMFKSRRKAATSALADSACPTRITELLAVCQRWQQAPPYYPDLYECETKAINLLIALLRELTVAKNTNQCPVWAYPLKRMLERLLEHYPMTQDGFSSNKPHVVLERKLKQAARKAVYSQNRFTLLSQQIANWEQTFAEKRIGGFHYLFEDHYYWLDSSRLHRKWSSSYPEPVCLKTLELIQRRFSCSEQGLKILLDIYDDMLPVWVDDLLKLHALLASGLPYSDLSQPGQVQYIIAQHRVVWERVKSQMGDVHAPLKIPAAAAQDQLRDCRQAQAEFCHKYRQQLKAIPATQPIPIMSA